MVLEYKLKHIIKADAVEKAIKQGASDTELAAILGVKIGAVRSQLTRMRKQLGENKIPLRKGPRKPKPDRKEADPKDALRLVVMWFGGAENAQKWAERICVMRQRNKTFLWELQKIFVDELFSGNIAARKGYVPGFTRLPATRYVVAVLRRAFPELPWQRSKQAREAAKTAGA